jgi:hypothetical protein
VYVVSNLSHAAMQHDKGWTTLVHDGIETDLTPKHLYISLLNRNSEIMNPSYFMTNSH